MTRSPASLSLPPPRYRALAREQGFEWLGPAVATTCVATGWRCPAGHVWSRSYRNQRHTPRCPQCTRSQAARQRRGHAAAASLSGTATAVRPLPQGDSAADARRLLQLLDTGDLRAQMYAARALGACLHVPGVIPRLAALAVSGRPPAARIEAIKTIGPLAGQDPAVRQAMVTALDDEIWLVQMLAMGALAHVAGVDAEAHDKLRRLLRARSARLRAAALECLQRGGCLADPATAEAVQTLLEDRDAQVRAAATRALNLKPSQAARIRARRRAERQTPGKEGFA